MFPNSLGKKAVCLNNVLNREILPALNRCEVCGKAESEHGDASEQAVKHAFKLEEQFPKWHGWHAAPAGTRKQSVRVGSTGESYPANPAARQRKHNEHVLHQDHCDYVTDAMEKLENAVPESLSGNEVATLEWKPTASSAVN